MAGLIYLSAAATAPLGKNSLVLSSQKLLALPFDTKVASTWNIATKTAADSGEIALINGFKLASSLAALGVINESLEWYSGKDSGVKTIVDIAISLAPFVYPGTIIPSLAYAGLETFYPGGAVGAGKDIVQPFVETSTKLKKEIIDPFIDIQSADPEEQKAFWERLFGIPSFNSNLDSRGK